MAEIITCPKCDRKLQVPEQFLGQTVQCPECRHQFVAQQSAVSATPIPTAGSASVGAKSSSTGQGRDYDEEDDDFDVRRRRREHDDDFDLPPRRYRNDFVPHRGGMVMALGLISLVGGFSFCLPVVLGPVAWILGAIDLREMREGRMDPAGEGMTRSGQVCGIISTILLVLGALLVMLMLLAG